MKRTTLGLLAASFLAASAPAPAQSFSIDEIDVAGSPRHEGKPSHTVWAGETAEIQARITVPGAHPIPHPHFSLGTTPGVPGATFVTPASLAPGTSWVVVGHLPHLLPGTLVIRIKGGAAGFEFPSREYTIHVLAPDLQARMPRPMAAWFEVLNEGTLAAPPTKALLTCRATSGGFGKNNTPVSGPNGCPAPFFTDPQGRWYAIPAIAPHGSYRVVLTGWDENVWAEGTYEFAAVVDAGNHVVEIMEGNNVARSGLRADKQGRVLP